MLDTYLDILTSKNVMEILTISKELLYELIRTKRIPAYKISKKEWRFNKEDILNYISDLKKQA